MRLDHAKHEYDHPFKGPLLPAGRHELAALAEKAGVSLSALRGFETGRVDTHASIIIKLERAIKAAGVKLLEPDRDGGQGVRLARR